MRQIGGNAACVPIFTRKYFLTLTIKLNHYMKKYITLTALLAAGTTLANAADLIAQWNNFADEESDIGSLSVGLGTNGATLENGVLKVTGASAGNSASARAFVDLGGLEGGGIAWDTGFSIVMSVSNYPSSTGGNYLFADMGATGYTGPGRDSGLGMGHANLATGNGSGIYSWAINNGGTFANSDRTVYEKPETPHLVLTFDGTDLNLYLGGTLVRSDEYGLRDGTTLATDAKFTKLYLGGYAVDSGNAKANYSLHSMSIYSGALTANEVASLVPEPSAFGMLAGLGALALVASRRRRK
ncbi:MAG: PEP-CTERM sorting domain-containing protein [Verrucomicrobia bacterium]|nr:PEP-CTERM sorting domain-containing protein [Verrucomicrobiota bacterium]